MDWNTPDLNSWPAKLVTRVSRKLRSNKEFTQQAIERAKAKEASQREKRRLAHAAKNHYEPRRSSEHSQHVPEVDELGEQRHSVFSEASTLVDHKDHTEMMHRLAHHDSFDSLVDQLVDHDKLKDPFFDSRAHDCFLRRVSSKHERIILSLPEELWQRVATFLTPLDAAQLALSSRALMSRLGRSAFSNLDKAENTAYKISLLHSMDDRLPGHLLCFPCIKFHKRLQRGQESLKADYVNNPLFHCPAAKSSVLPRLRLAQGRELPYAYVQLALRRSAHSADHGIPCEELARRWKHSIWSHRSRYMVHDSRLLMRVVSQTFAPPASTLTETAQRHILYDREEYVPCFSVCAHWRNGDLMAICKCALSHVPAPPVGYLQQLKKAPKINRALAHPNFIVRGCDWCRPARRCPECPTEYLVEIQMMEDANDPVHPFKHAIVVTRWSDLGDGSSPYTSPEWTAVKDERVGGHTDDYGSFTHVGRRAVSGIFESRISGSIPGQRMLSLNPSNKKLGEEGHGWY